MKKKSCYILFHLLLLLLFIFCQSQEVDKILTYRVNRGEFINKITCYGEIEAKKAVTVPCPDIWPQPKINWLIAEGTHVKTGDIVCTLDAAEIENNYQKALNELETIKAEFNKTKAELALNRAILESQVKTVEASAAIAKLQLPQLEYVSPTKKRIIELQVQRSDIEKEKLVQKLTALEIIHQSELNRMDMKIKQAENQASRAKMFLDKLTLTAPAEGIVVYAINWMTNEKVKEGDALWGGIPILQIPEVSMLQVRLKINETYIKRIQKGQAVTVHVDAKPEINLAGKVSWVASMGKPISRDSRIKLFESIVLLDSTNLSLQPGLTTTCDICVNSASDTLAIPLECVFDQDSLKVVYVRKGSRFTVQPVTFGASNDNFVMITNGLNGGEEVALSKVPLEIIDHKN